MLLVDRDTYRHIIGGFMKDKSLLVKYSDITCDDFGDKLYRFIFAVIFNMRSSGCEIITPKEVDLEIENHSSYDNAQLYKSHNGLTLLNQCYNEEIENFDYFYKRLKKLNLLRILKNHGYNISKWYIDSSDNYDADKEDEAIKAFDEAEIESIIGYYQGEISSIQGQFSAGCEYGGPAAEGLDELMRQLKDGPDLGYEMGGDIFNSVVKGARRGKFYIRSASSGVGKAIPNYTKIPMFDGTWKRVDEVKVGDYLIGKNGQPTKVLAVYPQKEKKEIYQVTLEDGRIAECCSEHLWEYYVKGGHNNSFLRRIGDTAKIIFEMTKRKDKNYDNVYLPLNKPVYYEQKEYSISPYVFGLILGDGSFRYLPVQKAFSFSSQDEELVRRIANEFNCYYKKNSEKNYSWSFQFKNSIYGHKNLWVEDILSKYPNLWNKKTEEKYIPNEYLYGSVQQRKELLAGLLDTDGSIDNKGRINFTTINSTLKSQVVQLCQSLGYIVTVLKDKRTTKYTTGVCYTLHIECDANEKTQIFKLKRHLQKAIEYKNNNKRKEQRQYIKIVNIQTTGILTDMTCFTVDAEDSLFLMNDYIVTHNTRTSVFDACHLCYPEHWSYKYNTFVTDIDHATGQTRAPVKTQLITTEMGRNEIQTIILAYLAGVDEDNIKYNECTPAEYERVMYAKKIVEKYKDAFYLDEISDPNLTNVETTIKSRVYLNGVEAVFYDYIFTSPSLVAQFHNDKMREDSALALLSNQLKQIAKDNNVFIMSSTQVNAEGMNNVDFKDAKCLRGA